MKKLTGAIKIRKTIKHPKGTAVIKMVQEMTTPSLPMKIVFGSCEQKKFEFYAENIHPTQAIGYLEGTDGEDILQKVLDDDLSYTISITGVNNSVFDATIEAEVSETAKEIPKSIFSEKIREVVALGVWSEAELNEKVEIMQEHKLCDPLIMMVLEWNKKYGKKVKRPKTIYVNPGYKGQESPLCKAIQDIFAGCFLIFEGDKSVGKNVCAETIAWLLGMPYYCVTMTRSMTADDIFGGKSTDNSAVESLDVSLAEDYLRYKNGEIEFLGRAAEYEATKARAASVSIVQEVSAFIEWLKYGGLMCFNEINMAEPNFLASFLNQIADDTGFIDLPGFGRINVNPNCILIGTQNAEYTGTCEQNDATMSRFGCIVFDAPKTIENQLRAATKDIADKVDDKFYAQTTKLYQSLLKSVQKGVVQNSCLNIRGCVRAIRSATLIPNASSLKVKIIDHVVNTCPLEDRPALIAQVEEIITI